MNDNDTAPGAPAEGEPVEGEPVEGETDFDGIAKGIFFEVLKATSGHRADISLWAIGQVVGFIMSIVKSNGGSMEEAASHFSSAVNHNLVKTKTPYTVLLHTYSDNKGCPVHSTIGNVII